MERPATSPIRSGMLWLVTCGDANLRAQMYDKRRNPPWTWIIATAAARLKGPRCLIGIGTAVTTVGWLGMMIMPASNTGMTPVQMVESALAIGWFGVSYFQAMPTPARIKDYEGHDLYNREFDRGRIRIPAVVLGVVLILQAGTGPSHTIGQVTLSVALLVTGICLFVLGAKRPTQPTGLPGSLMLASLGGAVVAASDYLWAWRELDQNVLAAVAVALTATGVLSFALGLNAARSQAKRRRQPPSGKVVELEERRAAATEPRGVVGLRT